MSINEPLIHWGIPGMKWGFRRSKQSSSKNTNNSSDHTTAAGLKKKKLSEMSNEELKKLNTRMQLERQYKDLSKSDISSGQKFVTEVIGNVGKQVATKYVADTLTTNLPNILKLLKPATGG